MDVFFELGYGLLATFGLLSMGWLVYGWLVAAPGGVYAVVGASGDGDDLEQRVKNLLWLGCLRPGYTVVIVDEGLTKAGRQLAIQLTKSRSDVVLWP